MLMLEGLEIKKKKIKKLKDVSVPRLYTTEKRRAGSAGQGQGKKRQP